MVVFCLIVFDSILIDFYKFFEFIGAILLQKILEGKNNTNPLFEFVLLPFGEQKNASIDLDLYALDSLNIQCE